MSIPVIDTLHALGNFPVVDSTEVQCGNFRLDVVLSQSATSLAAKVDKTYVDTNFAKKTEIPTDYGTYSKPSGGIPKTDLSSDVQASLGKADTALQSHQSLAGYVKTNDSRLTDSRPASDVYSWAKSSTKPTYTKSEVGLGNVDNTSDADKPVSTATQTALNAKASNSTVDAMRSRINTVETDQTALDGRISALEAGTTPEGSEVISIRTAADGTVYDNAGDSVRGQINGVNSSIERLQTYVGKNGRDSLELTNFVTSGSTKSIVTNFLILKGVEYEFKNTNSKDSKIVVAVDGYFSSAHYDVNRGQAKTCSFNETGYLKVWDNGWSDGDVININVKASKTVDISDFDEAITGSAINVTDSTFNLNNCVINKVYLFSAACVNAPVNRGGNAFTVSHNSGTSYYTQFYIDDRGKLYTRYRKGANWSDWNVPVLESDSAVLGSNNLITDSTFDLNNCANNKIYVAATTCVNSPADIGGSIISFAISNGSSMRGQLYIAQSGETYSRFKSSTAWSEWVSLSNKDEIYKYAKLSLFSRVAVIGDSYASGAIYTTSGAGIGDIYRISWLQQLARRNGFTGVNLSKGGLSTRTWLTDSKGLAKLNSEEACGLYILALGINDRYGLGLDYLGTISDIGTDADTFYGNYSKIINAVIAKSATARIVICTMANSTNAETQVKVEAFNTAIKNLATHFGIPCVDISKEPYFKASIYNNSMYGGHPTAVSYAAMATAYENAISKAMINNYAYFENGDYTN